VASSKVCIVDYKVGGNTFSVQNSLAAIGAKTYLSSDPKEISLADRIVFPGVGSFGIAMQQLQELGLIEVLREKAGSGLPFLGICVGMQVLFSYGAELADERSALPSGQGLCEGIGIFSGLVNKFDSKALKVPHIGWNTLAYRNDFNKSHKNPLFKGVENESSFYFVHSYRVAVGDDLQSCQVKYPQLEVAITDYGGPFISHIWDGHGLFACQFHVEKSGEAGLQLLRNFVNL
jgi:glutamine amidotransferase